MTTLSNRVIITDMIITIDYEKAYLDFKSQLHTAAKATQTRINKVLAITSMLEKARHSDAPEAAELVDECIKSQESEMRKLAALNTNVVWFTSEELLPELLVNVANLRDAAEIIDAAKLIESITAECCATANTRNTLRFEAQEGNHTVGIGEKVFTLAVMNMIQNAFRYALPATTIDVTVEGKLVGERIFVSIVVANQTSESLKAKGESDEYAKLGRPLVCRIAECYGGSFDYIEVGSKVIANLTLPLRSRPTTNKLGFSSRFNEYMQEKYSLVNMFMTDI